MLCLTVCLSLLTPQNMKETHCYTSQMYTEQIQDQGLVFSGGSVLIVMNPEFVDHFS